MATRMLLCLVLLSVGPLPAIAGEFTTSIGGVYLAAASALTTDSAGNTYVVGSRKPATALIALPSGSSGFLTKLDRNGNILFTHTFGGKGIDTVSAVAVDPAGNIYIAGATTSPDFPLSHALQTEIFPIGSVSGVPVGSGFIRKLSSDGTAVLYSTFFGGTLGQSAITSLATDASGNLYLTGYTQASDFPHTTGMPFGNVTQNPATPGAIIASISAAGDKILFSGLIAMTTPCTTTCISPGTIQWTGVGIAVDAAGNVYIAGNDPSATGLTTTAGVLSPNGIGAFVAKVTAGGTGLSYLTYIGSGKLGNDPFFASENTVHSIAVDGDGNAYLTGQTFDPSFPATAGSYRSVPQSPYLTSGFLAKLNPTGSAMVWATYLDAPASPQSVAVDASGNVWVTGTTNSSTPTNTNGWSTGPEFLEELNATGSKLIYSALFPTGTVAQSVAVDSSGLAHVAGSAGFISSIAPTPPSMKISYFGNAAGGNATARVSPAEVISLYGPGIGPAAAATATPTNGFYPTTLAGVQVTIDGVAIPLLYVSANQINAVAPMELSTDAAATVHVVNGTAVSADYPVWIVASAPQSFAPLLNQDGTVNSQSNAAPRGSIVTFYATGWQSSFPALSDGQVATLAQDICLGTCTASAVIPGFPFNSPFSLPATVLYGGAAPGLVAGITQFNVQLGTTSGPAGTLAFALTLGNPVVGQAVWIAP